MANGSAYADGVKDILAALKNDENVTAAVGAEIYEGIAPETAKGPFILIQSYDMGEDTAAQGGRVLTAVTVSVRVFIVTPTSDGSGSLGTLVPIYKAVDRALQATVTPITVTRSLIRGRELSHTLEEAGHIERALGGLYNLIVTYGHTT